MQSVLKALAEPRRVAILTLLQGGEMRAGDIAKQFETTRPAISEHLRVLTDAGLLDLRRDGTRRIYAVRPEGFEELRDFLNGFWNERFARLKTVVEREPRKPPRRVRQRPR